MEKYMLPDEKIMRPREGLEQPRLNFDENETYDLLDTLTGELKIQGWEINGEKMVNDNSAEASRAFYTPELSVVKNREINIFFLNTPDHYI